MHFDLKLPDEILQERGEECIQVDLQRKSVTAFENSTQ